MDTKDFEKRKEELQFGRYAASFWAAHSKFAERNVDVESKIFETFNSDTRRESIRQLSTDDIYDWEMKLLPFLVENGLTVIVISPLSDVPAIPVYVT